jgi:phosphoheptose isomerase
MQQAAISGVLKDIAQLITAMDEPAFAESVHRVGQRLQEAATKRQTVFIAGNGGSWTDADHFAGELRAQFEVKGRAALPSIALPASMSTLTAWGNDYDDGFEGAIQRDLEALSKPGDILIAISTSGKAVNIRRAMQWAKDHGLTIIAISGNGPKSGEFGALADFHICIPHEKTARIQEAYQVIVHILCMYCDTFDKGTGEQSGKKQETLSPIAEIGEKETS